jgi:3-methyladenine DNA glycosylase AlkD
MEEQINEIKKEIKKSLRLAMNGVVSTLQRRQGLNYKINFGVEIPRIKEIATRYGKSKQLAKALWQEDIRECRIIAILVMPVEEFTTDEANEWIATIAYTELADQLSMHLLSKMANGVEDAINRIQSTESIIAYCGFMSLAHLLRKSAILSKEQQKIYIEATENTICNNSDACTYVKQSARNTFAIFAESSQADREEIDKHSTLKELFA